MKNIKTKIILSVIVFLSAAIFINTVNAAVSSLYVSPASLTKNAGDTFSVSIGVNASGNKVCAVEGTLVFNNLFCQNITVAGDVISQSSPTCSNPHFLIGVPSCTTADKVLFTASVKGGSAGTASISFTGVDIIGEGVSIGSNSISGNYTINAVSRSSSASSTLTPTRSLEAPISKTPTPKITIPKTEQQVAKVPPEVIVIEKPDSLLAAISNFITLRTGNNIVGAVVIILIGLIIYLAYSYIVKKEKIK